MDASIIRYFQKELFSSFVPSTYAGHIGLGDSCQSGKMAALLNSLFVVFKSLVLPKHRVKYYYYNNVIIVRGAVGYNVIGV